MNDFFIPREISSQLTNKISESKIVVLRGPKQSGRKTILNHLFQSKIEQCITINCSDRKAKKLLATTDEFSSTCANFSIVILEEAQLLSNLQALIDVALEIDSIENLVLICSVEPALHDELWEVLRLQGLELILFPVSYPEMAQFHGIAQEDSELEKRLIFGYYPAIIKNEDEAEALLIALTDSFITSQLAASDRINKGEKLMQLLRLLAFHIGETISYNDLGKQCGLDNETVERYIHLFEKANIVFEIPSYFNENRYELKKATVVYFVDNGIRNALIRQFQPLMYRNDAEALWKNWVISERRKANQLAGRTPQTYFWKTHTKQQVDYIEVEANQINAFNMQLDKRKKIKFPTSFTTAYPEVKTAGVNRSSFWTYIMKK